MIYSHTGAVKVQVEPLMHGLPFALKFFDDDHNLYVSQELFDQVKHGNAQMQYVVMSWRTDQISIQDAVIDIINRIKQYGKDTGQLPD